MKHTVKVIDDCTLEITDFTYDGGGPDVAFYGGMDRAYSDDAGGIRLGPWLNGREYAGNTLRLNLPDNVTLDDINSLSVWCFDFAVSFGDVFFGE